MPKAKPISPITQVDSFFKRSVWTVILDSLATIILGVLLVVWPELVVQILSYVVGIFFMVKGLIAVINYFVSQGYRNFYNNDLLSGVIQTLIGIAALAIGPANIADVFRIIIGIWIIYSGLIRINIAIKLSVAQSRDWLYILLVGICMLVLGGIIVFTRGAVVTIVGWTMVACGIIGIVGDVIFVMHLEDLKSKINQRLKM